AVGDGVARVGLAGADVDDVLVGGGDADGADGDGPLVVELVLEGAAVVDGLDEAAGGAGDPVGGGVGLEDADGGDAAAHVGRADGAPVQRGHPVGRQGAGRAGGGRGGGRGLLQLGQLLGERLHLLFDVGDLL